MVLQLGLIGSYICKLHVDSGQQEEGTAQDGPHRSSATVIVGLGNKQQPLEFQTSRGALEYARPLVELRLWILGAAAWI